LAGRIKGTLINCSIVFASIAFTLGTLEVILRTDLGWTRQAAVYVQGPLAVPLKDALAQDEVPAEVIAKAEAHRTALTIPDEIKVRRVTTPGSTNSYYWQGALHVHDENGFRRSAPFPPKRPSVKRVLIFGDSLTYGYGVAEEDTFAALLERWHLGQVEFLNLGHTGFQSEDVLNAMKRFVPELAPDLVFYGVCLNDFLPSSVSQYEFLYSFPLPAAVKDWVIARSKVAALTSDLYDATLRRLHIRRDFFTDILFDLEGYQKRFAHDVANMNALIRAAGLPPLVAMVLDQYPNMQSFYPISTMAEQHLREAGADIIGTDDYYHRYNGAQLHVAPWEGHPNEIAHFVWARMMDKHLRNRSLP
jgi:hypothetical protein